MKPMNSAQFLLACRNPVGRNSGKHTPQQPGIRWCPANLRRRGKWRKLANIFPALAFMCAVNLYSSPLDGLLLTAAFDKLTDQLNQAISDARNAGNSVAIEAGRQANIAIENAKNTYLESLNKTVDTLDPKIKGIIDQLQTVVNEVSSAVPATVNDAAKQAQQIVNSLPFREHEPQLTKVLPSFVVPAKKSYPARVEFNGNFEFAAKSGFTPTLMCQNKSFSPSENTTQKLVFLVNVDDLFTNAAASSPDKYNYTTAKLQVPWQTTSWFFFHTDHHDQYNLIVGALPKSPGSLKLTHTVAGTKTETKGVTSPNFHIASTKEAGNNDQKDVPCTFAADPGWHVVRSPNHDYIGIGSQQGELNGPNFQSDSGDQVTYTMTTIHKTIGPSGSIDFSIHFTESRDVPVQTSSDETIDLVWGDSHSFQYPAGTWKLVFDAFDGSHAEFTGADLGNKFIKLRDQQGSMNVSTTDPQALVWP